MTAPRKDVPIGRKRVAVSYRPAFPAAKLETKDMSTAKQLNLVSVADYLAGELISPIKHEYLGGVVYAMAGARNAHNLIATNSLGALFARLKGRTCRPYNSD